MAQAGADWTRVMRRWLFRISLGWLAATVVVLAAAVAWGPHHCKAAFPMVIGCAIGSYEALTGGMIAAGAALVAGWLAWSAVQRQIEAEEKRAAADRTEVEKVLQGDLNSFAEGLAELWKILDRLERDETLGPDELLTRLGGVVYGIERITRKTWLDTSRKMVAVLGWKRRREYEELFEGLKRLGGFQDATNFDVGMALSAVRSVSYDFELLRPDTAQYFEGLFRRTPKAWTLGDEIKVAARVVE